MTDKCMAGLVVGDDLPFVLADHPALPFGARDHTVDGLVELRHAGLLLIPAGGKDRAFVDEIRKVGSGKARCLLGNHHEVDLVLQRLALRVHLEDRLAATDIGPVENDLAIEAARTQQRRVQDVGPVGGSEDDHVCVCVESIHLYEDLVQRLLALVVTAPQARATHSPNSVNLVDEDDARRVALRLLEQVPDAGGAHTDEHLNELGAADGEERHACLAGDGTREQRLTGPRRPQ